MRLRKLAQECGEVTACSEHRVGGAGSGLRRGKKERHHDQVRRFSQAEAHPLHLECADLCDFAPKCGKLDCIICRSGELCSRSPLVLLVAKKRRGLMFNYGTARQLFSVVALLFAFFSLQWSY